MPWNPCGELDGFGGRHNALNIRCSTSQSYKSISFSFSSRNISLTLYIGFVHIKMGLLWIFPGIRIALCSFPFSADILHWFIG